MKTTKIEETLFPPQTCLSKFGQNASTGSEDKIQKRQECERERE